MRLDQLKSSQSATISQLHAGQAAVTQHSSHLDDTITLRLQTLGFVPGEQVQVLARGLFGGEPILVKVGLSRFALRKQEAARIEIAI